MLRNRTGEPTRATSEGDPRPAPRAGRVLKQQEFGFDAQQFGSTPALVISGGLRQRLVDHCQCPPYFSRAAQSVREFCKRGGVIKRVAGIPEFIDRDLKQLQSLRCLPRLMASMP